MSDSVDLVGQGICTQPKKAHSTRGGSSVSGRRRGSTQPEGLFVTSRQKPYDRQVKNFRVFAPLVTGDQMELHDCDTGQQVIAQLFSHEWGAPPRSIVLEAIAKDGRIVRIIVPNDGSDAVKVAIEDRQ
jgi:hypothetical protein